jgi:multiple sugar transport system permease protein
MSKNNTVYIGKNKNFWDRNRRSGGYLLKKRSGQIAISIVRALLLFGLCFMIIQPLLIRFSMSLMEERDLYDSTIILLPRHVTLENYVHVANLNDLPRSMLNTLWVSLLISFSQIVSCTLVAYGFARYEFKFKKFWFGCVLAVIIIPPQTIQSALYTNFANFDILRIFTYNVQYSFVIIFLQSEVRIMTESDEQIYSRYLAQRNGDDFRILLERHRESLTLFL